MSKKLEKMEARRLRKEGISVNEIAKILGVSKASVSIWVRDIELSQSQKDELEGRQHRFTSGTPYGQQNREKYLELRKQYQQTGREKAKEKNWLHCAGCMLYWTQGANHRNRIHFANTDPNVHLIFMRFLREQMQVEDEIISIYIHCHNYDSEEIAHIENYWLDLLQLTRSNLRKTQIKEGDENRRHTLKNGVCTISINRTELVQQIFGAIQEYCGFDNPDWLT